MCFYLFIYFSSYHIGVFVIISLLFYLCSDWALTQAQFGPNDHLRTKARVTHLRSKQAGLKERPNGPSVGKPASPGLPHANGPIQLASTAWPCCMHRRASLHPRADPPAWSPCSQPPCQPSLLCPAGQASPNNMAKCQVLSLAMQSQPAQPPRPCSSFSKILHPPHARKAPPLACLLCQQQTSSAGPPNASSHHLPSGQLQQPTTFAPAEPQPSRLHHGTIAHCCHVPYVD